MSCRLHYQRSGVYLLQGVHTETLVHAGGVGQEGGEGGFETEAKVQHPVPERGRRAC